MPTLRELAQQRGWNVDWDQVNSTQGGGNLGARQSLWDYVQGINPYGSNGPVDYYSYNPGGGGDAGGGGPIEGFGRAGQDISNQMASPSLLPQDYFKGYSPAVWGSNNMILGDRGDYNYAVPDIGNLIYDPEKGLLNNQEMIQGSRVSRSFDNFNTLTQAAIAAMAGGAGYQALTGNTIGAAAGGASSFGGELTPLALDTTSAGSITPWGAYAGQGTGFNGFGAGGLMSGGGGGGGSLGLDPYEVDMAAGSVSQNQPGVFEHAQNWARQNVPSWAQNGLNNAMSNPMNALRLGQGIAGLAGSFRGGSSQPATQSAKSGGGPAQMNQVQRPQYTPNPYTQQQLEQYRRFG